jgi:predicted dehydrogenase/acetyltransferase-like isoleucine patch superfamily enzyme
VDTRIALVGCGYWGKNIGRALAELRLLAGVVDGDAERAATYADEYSTSARTFDEVLADDTVAGVAIATPAGTHVEIASRALKAGKDVFVEKPMALHPEHGEAMVSLAEAEGRILMVGHLLQYHPAFMKLKELVAAGDLGRLQYLYSNRLNFGKIRREEDVLWSFAPHDLSMILSLAGEPPSEVRTEGRFVLHGRIADVTTTHLAFASGLAGHVFVSWLHPMKEQRLVVIGEQGMAVFDDREPLERKLALYQTKVQWLDGQPVAPKAEPAYVELATTEPLVNELSHFHHCIQTRERPRTDGAEGLRVLNVLTEASRQLLAANQGVPGTTLPLSTVASGPPDPSAAVPSAGASSVDLTAPSAPANGAVPGAASGAAPASGGDVAPTAQVHATAVVDEGAVVGDDTRIWHFSHVMPNTVIGAGCSLGQNVVAGPNVRIGSGCKIQNNVSVYDGVTLEDDVFCGPSMVFTNVTNPRAFVNRKDEFAPTLVRRGASIGANATIVCGTTIGEYAFVAAGAVVTADVAPYALMVGVPARRIGWVSREGEVLDQSLVCPRTGEAYEEVDGALRPLSSSSQTDPIPPAPATSPAAARSGAPATDTGTES